MRALLKSVVDTDRVNASKQLHPRQDRRAIQITGEGQGRKQMITNQRNSPESKHRQDKNQENTRETRMLLELSANSKNRT